MIQDDIVTEILFRVEGALREHLRANGLHGIVPTTACNRQHVQRSAIDDVIAVVWGVENAIRNQWGGANIYITKRAQQTWAEKKQSAINEAKKTGRIKDAATRHGVPRSSLYRWIQKRD